MSQTQVSSGGGLVPEDPNLEGAYEIVVKTINGLSEKADAIREELDSVVESLKTLEINIPNFDDNPNIDFGEIVNIDSLLNQVTPILNNILNATNTTQDFIAEVNSSINQLPPELNIDSLFSNAPQPPSLVTYTPPSSPNISLPNKPVLQDPITPTQPNIDIPTPPVKPTLTMPNKPNLLDINLPSPPQIELPEVPQYTAPAIPSTPNLDTVNLNDYSEPDYQKQFDTLPDDIKNMMIGGDIDDLSTIERNMIERLYTQAEEKFRDELEGLKNHAEKMGYILPPGFFMKELENIKTRYMKERSILINKIQETLSELNMKNRQLGLGTAIDYERNYMNIFEKKMDRRLQYYGMQLDKVLKQLDANLRIVAVYYDDLKAKLQLFTTQVDNEKTKLQIYTTQLDGQKTIAALNENILNAYTAELDAVKTQAALYESQVKAYSTEVEAVMSKIDIFKSQIAAYTAQLDANKAKLSAYQSEIDAEKTKIDMFESQMRAFVSQIQAENLKLESYKTLMQTFISKVQAQIDVYRIKADFIIRGLGLKNDIYRIAGDLVQISTAMYRNMSDIILKSADIKSTVWTRKIEGEIKLYSSLLQKYATQVDAALKDSNLNMEKLKATAGVISTITAAYINAINVAASATDSESTIVQG